MCPNLIRRCSISIRLRIIIIIIITIIKCLIIKFKRSATNTRRTVVAKKLRTKIAAATASLTCCPTDVVPPMFANASECAA